MKIVMVPGACVTPYQGTGGSFCESCFARFVRQGCEPNLACITAVEDDASPETTLEMRSTSYSETLHMTVEERERLADGGWTGWIDFVERAEVAARRTATL